MNRSTKALLRTAAFAPAAVLVALVGGPALAAGQSALEAGEPASAAVRGPGPVSGDEGPGAPFAAAMGDQLKSVTGQLVPRADLAHPETLLPGSPNIPLTSPDGAISLTRGGLLSVNTNKAGGQQVSSKLGKGVVRGRPSAFRSLSFSGVTARCVSTADGSFEGVTTIDQGKLIGGLLDKVASLTNADALNRALPDLPANPPANFRVPLADPKTDLLLNKQVKDAFGGMTVSAVSLGGSSGAARELGVAHCAPLTGRIPQPGDAGPLSSVSDQLKGLVGQAKPLVEPVLGGLTGAPAMPSAPDLTGASTLPRLAGELPMNPQRLLPDPAGALPVSGLPGIDAKGGRPAGTGGPSTVPINLGGLFGGLPGLPSALPIGGFTNG